MVEHDGTRLKILMDRAGVTQAQLAEVTKVSEQAVWKWIQTGKIARKHLATICAKLRCSSDELLGIVAIRQTIDAAKESGAPTPIFTKERRADDDVTALQIGLESLASAVLRQVPAAAGGFLAEMARMADELNFSQGHGLLGSLGEIADEAQLATEGEGQARRRAGSAGDTRREKSGQER